MGATFRLLRADFRSNTLQQGFIFLLLLLATAALTTSLSIQSRGGTAWEELFRESDGAHAWVYTDDAGQLGTLAAQPEVAGAVGPFPMAGVVVSGPGPQGQNGVALWLEGAGVHGPEFGGPVVTSGRWVEADDEVVLPRRFGADNGLHAGDTVTVASGSETRELRIVGLAVFAGRSPFVSPQIGWTTAATAGSLGTSDGFAGMALQFESRNLTRSFFERLEREGVISETDPGALPRIDTWSSVRSSNDEATGAVVTFLGIFSVFALIAASSVIVNVISARVLARYRDIGLLKAIGFTPRQVTAGFVLGQLAVAVPAVCGGLIAGLLLVPLLEDPASKEFATGSLGYFRLELLAAIGVGVTSLVALATIVPAWRAGRTPVVEAVVFGPHRVSVRTSRLAVAARALRLPSWAATGVKDAFDRPMRSWLTIGALTLSVVTVTFVATSEWTIRQLMARPELLGEPFEVAAESDRPEVLKAAIEGDPATEAFFSRNTVTVAVPGSGGEVTLAFLGSGYEHLDWQVWKGRLFGAPGEATVGKGFLEATDSDIGDTVTMQVAGRPVALTIVGAYRATEDDGRWAMTSVETARIAEPGFVPSGYAVALKDGADARVSAARYREAGATDIEVFDHGADGVNGVRAVMGGLAAMLLLVGLVSLVNTIASGVHERRRDFGVLKAIGFTPRQVVGSVLAGTLVLAAVTLAAGLPLGVWMSASISDWMGNGLGWGPGLLEMAPARWLVGLVPLVLTAALAAAYFPARAAAGVRAGEALRNE